LDAEPSTAHHMALTEMLDGLSRKDNGCAMGLSAKTFAADSDRTNSIHALMTWTDRSVNSWCVRLRCSILQTYAWVGLGDIFHCGSNALHSATKCGNTGRSR
jgi:hypothetical protein